MDPAWIWVFLAISVTALGHIAFKIYADHRQLVWLGLTGLSFVTVPVFSFFALKTLTVAQVYLCAAAVPLITTFAARVALKETVTIHHIIGIAMTTIGTVIYLTFS